MKKQILVILLAISLFFNIALSIGFAYYSEITITQKCVTAYEQGRKKAIETINEITFGGQN